MTNTRFVRKAKAVALTTMLAGGMLLTSSCTLKDIRQNLVSGSLGYVKSHATAFWNAFLSPTDLWTGVFD